VSVFQRQYTGDSSTLNPVVGDGRGEWTRVCGYGAWLTDDVMVRCALPPHHDGLCHDPVFQRDWHKTINDPQVVRHVLPGSTF